MAGQALYRKWRSQTFSELVGQEHIVQTLRNAIRTERLGHAYLFTGPRGVGKTTMARLLAKAVNCLAPIEQRPCDECAECRAIAEGRAVDVIEMDAASHTGVDDAREIIERVQFRPTSARVKVYVIDETHMLSTAAFNALLKTLEEPPAHVLFILATTEIHKVPATIISRCQRFVFNRHSISDIVGHLEHVAHEEQVGLEPGVAEQIARAATGAMRDALSVLDQLMAGSNGSITLAQVQGLLGSAESGEVSELISALIGGDVQSGLHTIHQVADNGADLRQFARDIVDHLRSLMVLSATNDASSIDLPVERVEQLQAQASQTNVGQVVAWLKLFANLDYQLKTSPYGQLPLEMAFVEALTGPVVAVAPIKPAAVRPNVPPALRPTSNGVAAKAPAPPAARPVVPLDEVVPPEPVAPPVPAQVPASDDALVAENEVETSNPEVQPQPEALEVTASADTTEVIEVEDNAAFLLEDVLGLWEQYLEDIRAESPLINAQMKDVVPINIEAQTVILLARQPWQKSKLEIEKTRRLLERVLSKTLNARAFIRVTTDEQEEMPDARKLIQHARSDPLVRKAANIFEASITEVQIL